MAKTIDLKKLVKTIHGVEVKQADEKGKMVGISYGDVITELLASPNRNGADLMKCWRLAQKIVGLKVDTIQVEDNEMELIKTIIGENFLAKDPQTKGMVERYTSFVVAQIIDYLDLLK